MPPYPLTVAEAVDRLLNELTEENIENIRHMKKEDLNDLHFGLGMWIRNNFGLWQNDSPLMKDLGLFVHPDDAAGEIIDALWQRLQKE